MKTFKSNGTSFNLVESSDLNPNQIDLDHENLYLIKSLKCVGLFFNYNDDLKLQANSWNTICQLPGEFCPNVLVKFNVSDRNTDTYADSKTIGGAITHDGKIQIWGYPDKLTIRPVGSVMYFIL